MAEHPILRERAALCDLFEEVGPDAPTWCGDWTTHDLAAHLWAREHRPDAGPGLVLGGIFAKHTQKIERKTARRPYAELVDALRDGPPVHWAGRWIPEMDVHEWFVHHEDVRRPSGREPRADLGELDDKVWSAIGRFQRMLISDLDVGLRLRAPDGRERIAKKGSPEVVLTAPAGELLLRLFGRPVEVEVSGPPEAIAAFESASFGL